MRGRLAVGMLAGVVSLGACSSDPQPKTLPPLQSTAASPSVSPAATVPEIPSAAMEKTADGASAYARYYLDVLGAALANADATTLKSLSSTECGPCGRLVALVAEEASRKQTREGGEYVVLTADTPVLTSDVAVVELTYTRSASRIVGADGAVVSSNPPVETTVAQLTATWTGSAWLTTGYRVAA